MQSINGRNHIKEGGGVKTLENIVCLNFLWHFPFRNLLVARTYTCLYVKKTSLVVPASRGEGLRP